LTNLIAFWLIVLILGAGAALYFLARKFLDLVEWVAFWR
jgi:hypothetical protein